jgi:hypothetical protein
MDVHIDTIAIEKRLRSLVGGVDREPIIQGEFPERSTTIGFKITGMGWLGHPTGDERFF